MAAVRAYLWLGSQPPSGMVGRSGTLQELLWRFWAVRRDTTHSSFLWLGRLQRGEA